MLKKHYIKHYTYDKRKTNLDYSILKDIKHSFLKSYYLYTIQE